MENTAFLQSIGVTDIKQETLVAMEKYADNHWWELDVDPRKYAYYQLNEPIFLGNDFSHFHQSVELLLGRPVWTHEFGISADKLRQEAERAWKYQVGVTSDKERQERIAESMNNLHTWAKENNKPIINIQLPEE